VQDEQKPSLEELGGLYRAAKTEQERRDICFRAIDSGWIRRQAPLSQIDAILGTHLVMKPRPGSLDDMRREMIYFRADPASVKGNNRSGRSAALGRTGWYMVLVYNLVSSNVQDYYVSNVEKRLSHFCKSARN
jgi:hypothetical protein